MKHCSLDTNRIDYLQIKSNQTFRDVLHRHANIEMTLLNQWWSEVLRFVILILLYSDKFSTAIFVPDTSRCPSVLPQIWSICSSPLSESFLQSLKFRNSRHGRVSLYSAKFSPVILLLDILRDLKVLPQN